MAYTDAFYHGDEQKRSYFEGWYFKHRMGGDVYSFIPGMAVNRNGEKKAFVQTISTRGSAFIGYPFREFAVLPQKRLIRVGENEFSPEGIRLNLESGSLSVKGSIRYSGLTPLERSVYAPGIMGPFSYLSFMECYHGVISLHHTLDGQLAWNGRTVSLSGGAGYIEKDFGRSFPKSWFWYQCGGFSRPGDCVMLALARIPFAGAHFLGILSVSRIGGEEIRLATYYGARLVRLLQTGGRAVAEIAQGRTALRVEIAFREGKMLKAPVLGNMCRTISEVPSCSSRVTLWRGGRVFFRDIGRTAGFEQVGSVNS